MSVAPRKQKPSDLALIRLAAGLTQAQVAAELGLTRQRISQYELADKPSERALRILEALGRLSDE